MDIGEACHKNDLKFLLKTNAYVNKEPWSEICSVTDAMNIDWKGAGNLYRDITGAIEYVTEDRVAEAFYSGVHVEVSIPVYFYTGDEMLYLSDFVYFLANLNDEIACHVDVIHSSFNYNRTITKNDLVYENVFNILHQNMSNVFVE